MDCSFCREFECRVSKIQDIEIANRVLFKSKNFNVFPTIGSFIEGYLLISPRDHHISIGAIPRELYPELEEVKEKVRRVLKENYQIPLFFEHGPASNEKKAGCCVEHAHLHAVPVNAEVIEDLKKHFQHFEISSYSALKDEFEKGNPYFFVEDQNRNKHLFRIIDIVPSQYIRQVISSRIGMPEKWDWRFYPELDNILKTIERLKDKF